MRRSSEFLAALSLAVAACGQQSAPGSAGAPASSAAMPPAGATATRNNAATARSAAGAFADRTGELVNPENHAMVFLYHDLAGLTPPFDQWTEEDGRVKWARGPDRAALRQTVRAEFESAAAAVRGVGSIRLSMHANLSDYDPTYGEFTVRGLAPSSVISFDALGQKISLKFGNGRHAQIWRVPAAEAQVIRDKLGYGGNASLDALLRITGVQPAPGGGTITADVVEYELRQSQNGQMLGRVQLATH